MTGKLEVNKAELFKRLGYRPMPHQWDYHNSPARFRVLCGGRRSGKTQAVGLDRAASLLQPNTLGWIVGSKYTLGAKEFRVLWDALIVHMGLGSDNRVSKSFNIKQGDMYIEFPWKSRVQVVSAAHPDTLLGEGLDWAIMSEAAQHSRKTWEMYIRPALSDKRGPADFGSTPRGKNWWYKLWTRGLEGGNSEYQSWRVPSWVNTEVYPGGEEDPEIVLLRETTLEEWFEQEIAAEFSAVVGRIFGEFDEETHVRPHTFRPDWPNYLSVDFGFANPLAAVEFQVAPDDTIYVWREHYEKYRTLEWHVDTLKNRSQPDGYRLDMAFGDCADPEGVEYISQHLVYCMADNDSKLWLTGVRLMKRLMKLEHDGVEFDDYERPVEKAHYYVDPSCENHIRELVDYRVKESVGPNEFTGAGVVAKNCDDHSVDAIRYGLMHLYEVGVSHHLNEVSDVNRVVRQPEKGRELVGSGSRASSNGGTFFTLGSVRNRF